jgi:hypothetical protein
MLAFLALATARAAAPVPARTDDEVAAKKAIDAAYGKEVPWAAICSADVAVEGGGAGRLIGVQRRETGCEPFGVWAGGAFTPVANGLGALLPPDAWKALAAPKRDAVLTAWVDDALLAFAAPSGAPSVAHAGGRTQVTRSFLRRDGEAGRAAEVKTVFDFDAAGALAGRTDTVGKVWQTRLFVQEVSVTGLAANVAQTGLESSGGAIQRCWQEAWEADRTVAGTARLEWTVGGGKASRVTEIDTSSLPAPIVTCIGNALQRTTWPADAAGTARYVFALDRR